MSLGLGALNLLWTRLAYFDTPGDSGEVTSEWYAMHGVTLRYSL